MDAKQPCVSRSPVPTLGLLGLDLTTSCGRVVWDEREIPCRFLLFGVDGRWGLWNALSEAEREAIALQAQ